MPDSPNGKRLYEIHCSETVAKELYQFQESASPGRRHKIATAFRQILKALRRDPKNVGEPAYRLGRTTTLRTCRRSAGTLDEDKR